MEIKGNNRTLFIGNGLNRSFNGDSWRDLINKAIEETNQNFKYDDIKSMPATMQIVAASGDKVDERVKTIAESLRGQENSEPQNRFLKQLFDLNIKDIITTNYSYELEQALGLTRSTYNYQKCRTYTIDKKSLKKKGKLYRLYEYCDVNNHNIWHIHGNMCRIDSIILGHYYYGKLLSQIEEYTSTVIKRYKRKPKDFYKSWVDHFLADDVYMLGFGLDLSEIDIWWLLCFKKRHFSNTKVYYYTYKGELDKEENKQKKLLLQMYGVIIKDNIKLIDEDYISYYTKTIKSISKELKK